MANGLNQYTQSGAVTPTYDARGNLTSAGGASYAYSQRGQLSGYPGGTLYYDPPGRLDLVYDNAGAHTTFDYDGANLAAEGVYGGTPIARRYVFGPGIDEPLVWYEGAGTSDRRYLHADERGSIVAVSDGAGAALAINAYDDYGIPGANNLGRFQYTGQAWVPELGMYYYKARMYSPTLGRFLQPDPIGYGDGLNWYDYVGGDPVNFTDPLGLQSGGGDIVVFSCRNGQQSVPDAREEYGIACIPLLNTKTLREVASVIPGGGGPRGRFTVEPYPPQRVTVDPNCSGVPAASDPAVQKQALAAMRLSLSPSNPAGATEFGFAVSEPYLGSRRYIGPIFSEGHKAEISGEFIDRNSPSAVGNLLTGYYPTSVVVHTHPNNNPPSPISDADRDLSRPVVAIDKAGNMTCSVGR